jgi:hypothetical protein
MSNLLIETSAIKTFLKSSSFKHFSGKFCPSSSSPFPKARNLEQTSLKMFVLRLFGRFMPLYPTPKGCRRFHSTHKLGRWTSRTSNPSNASSAVLKTGGDGGWLTAVVRWHMRCLLRPINWWRHARASGLCTSPFALSCTHRAMFDTTVCHRHTPSMSVSAPSYHTAVTFQNAFMHAGTTSDAFQRDNLDWLGYASNWSNFTATAALGVIHKGNFEQGMVILGPYLPSENGGESNLAGAAYSEGGALYGLGVINAGVGAISSGGRRSDCRRLPSQYYRGCSRRGCPT